MEGAVPRYRIDLVKSILPAEPPVCPVRLEEEVLRQVLCRDYALCGVIELDHILAGTPIGKKNERKACASIALAVDAESSLGAILDALDGPLVGQALAAAPAGKPVALVRTRDAAVVIASA